MYSSSFVSRLFVLGAIIFVLINQISTTRAPASAARLRSYRLKRSFYDDNCKGIYDKTIYSRVYQVCEDCYNLMREQKLHSLCRKDCFSSQFFKGCLEMLHMQDEIKQYEEWIIKLKGLGI